jgi:putative membrane protein
VAVIALLAAERAAKRIWLAAVVFVLAGALGAVTWNLPLLDPLFALFVGFFTMPALLHGEGIGKGDEGVKQKTERLHIRPLLPYILLGVVLGGLADLLPGMSTPAQIAVFAALLLPLDQPALFLALVAAIEASHTAFALTSSASVGVARVGVIAMVAQNAPIRPEDLPMLMGVFALAVGVGALALLWLGKRVMRHWQKIDWTTMGRILAAYLVFVIWLNDGWLGLAALSTATAIGMLPAAWGVRRTHVMGALILPAMAHAFGMM